jgi:PqqD family protein of HPr-rel-A system
LVQWGDTYVAYHRPSGKTHFLNGVMAELLGSVLVTERTADSVAEELAARQGAAVDPDFRAAVADSLAQLDYLGLIERCER